MAEIGAASFSSLKPGAAAYACNCKHFDNRMQTLWDVYPWLAE